MSKTVNMNPDQEVYALDSSELRTVEDIVNFIRGMKAQITEEDYNALPPEIQKLFKKVPINEFQNNFL